MQFLKLAVFILLYLICLANASMPPFQSNSKVSLVCCLDGIRRSDREFFVLPLIASLTAQCPAISLYSNFGSVIPDMQENERDLHSRFRVLLERVRSDGRASVQQNLKTIWVWHLHLIRQLFVQRPDNFHHLHSLSDDHRRSPTSSPFQPKELQMAIFIYTDASDRCSLQWPLLDGESPPVYSLLFAHCIQIKAFHWKRKSNFVLTISRQFLANLWRIKWL